MRLLTKLSFLLLLAACTSGPHYQGPNTDNFNGERFLNRKVIDHGGFGAFLKWRLTRNAGQWKTWTDVPYGPAPLKQVNDGNLRITVVNHATTLIQMDGLNILTDPIFSERASPFSWIGPKRVRPPGIRFDDLPHIHLVIVSHNHYDHLDLPTLLRLNASHHPLYIVGLGNRALLQDEGIDNVQEINWWQTLTINPQFQVTGVPAQHFSSRGLTDRMKTLWTGYVLHGKAGNVYFAGDTGFGPHFKQINDRFHPIRLALLPIGAYLPRWFMSGVHISPQEAVIAHLDLQAMTSVAMHYGTFELGDDGQTQAETELRNALKSTDINSTRFWILDFGEGLDVP